MHCYDYMAPPRSRSFSALLSGAWITNALCSQPLRATGRTYAQLAINQAIRANGAMAPQELDWRGPVAWTLDRRVDNISVTRTASRRTQPTVPDQE